jgi:hypothetical protein
MQLRLQRRDLGVALVEDLGELDDSDDVGDVVGVIQAAEAARVQGEGGGGMRAPIATGPSDA